MTKFEEISDEEKEFDELQKIFRKQSAWRVKRNLCNLYDHLLMIKEEIHLSLENIDILMNESKFLSRQRETESKSEQENEDE